MTDKPFPTRTVLTVAMEERDGETEKTKCLFRHLHRGGEFAHLWSDRSNQSYWFHVSGRFAASKRTVPRAWRYNNVYFTVHPLSQIPPTNVNGKSDPHYISSQLPYIAAINTLFAEYDGKEYVWPWDYTHHLPERLSLLNPQERRTAIQSAKEQAFYLAPEKYKNRLRQVIEALDYPPSVVIDSGGGYHCYWLLRQPVLLDESNRADIQTIQHCWVRMVKGDPGAADLRRVLRMPGSFNMKPGFGDIHPRVSFVTADFDRQYNFQQLDEAVNDWLFAQRPHRATPVAAQREGKTSAGEGTRAAFNQRHSLVDLLVAHGYQLSFRGRTGTRLARPGRDKAHSSVIVFPAQNDGAPELSIHFSTNDALFSAETIDPKNGQVRRHAHDAFAVYVQLEHDGDWQAAYRAVDSRATDGRDADNREAA